MLINTKNLFCSLI